jgi:Spy/CpxP family protein refolding chaperone
MNNTNANRRWLMILGILLLANLAVLAYFIIQRKSGGHSDRRGQMSAYLKKEIGFSDAQMAHYETIKARQRAESKAMFDSIRDAKTETFRMLGAQGFSDSSIAAIAKASAAKQQNMETIMLMHLREIREICTPEQRKRFDTSYYRVLARPRDPKK